MKPETRFKIRALADLRTLGWAEKIQQKAIRGTPDILACIKGWFIALELKVERNKADPLQDHELRKIDKAGGMALVVYPDDWAEVMRQLAALPERREA